MGYHRAGFDVVGVDLHPQPRYPFAFVQADALAYLDELLSNGPAAFGPFAAIHASPPCQAYSKLRTIHKRQHPDLIVPVRERLERTGLPWVIENVPGSPLHATLMLCGSSFGLAAGRRHLERHRYFETNWPLSSLVPPCDHRGRQAVGVYGHGRWDNATNPDRGGYQGSKAECAEAMGIDWMTLRELTQAIPPAMTEWIGALMPRVAL